MVVKVKLDKGAVLHRTSIDIARATEQMANQALKDCNFYAKHKDKDLINSSIPASDLKKGLLIWDTPYARRQYYIPYANTDKNPNARGLWCEYAESIHGEEWRKTAQKVIDGEI